MIQVIKVILEQQVKPEVKVILVLKVTQELQAVKAILGIEEIKEILVLAVMRKQVGNCWWIKYKPQQHCQRVSVKVIV